MIPQEPVIESSDSPSMDAIDSIKESQENALVKSSIETHCNQETSSTDLTDNPQSNQAEALALAELEKDAQIQELEFRNNLENQSDSRSLSHRDSISRASRETWIKRQEEDLIMEAKLRKQQEQLAKFEQEQLLIKSMTAEEKMIYLEEKIKQATTVTGIEETVLQNVSDAKQSMEQEEPKNVQETKMETLQEQDLESHANENVDQEKDFDPTQSYLDYSSLHEIVEMKSSVSENTTHLDDDELEEAPRTIDKRKSMYKTDLSMLDDDWIRRQEIDLNAIIDHFDAQFDKASPVIPFSQKFQVCQKQEETLEDQKVKRSCCSSSSLCLIL